MTLDTTNPIEIPALQEFINDIEKINKTLTLVKEYLKLRAESNVLPFCKVERKDSANRTKQLLLEYKVSITTYKQGLTWVSHLTPITRELDALIEELNLNPDAVSGRLSPKTSPGTIGS